MRRISALLPVLFCAVPTLAQDKTALVVEQDQSAPVKLVYHIDDAAAQALNAPRKMRNQMDAARKTKIVVVTHGDGVDFLFDGALYPISQMILPRLLTLDVSNCAVRDALISRTIIDHMNCKPSVQIPSTPRH